MLDVICIDNKGAKRILKVGKLYSVYDTIRTLWSLQTCSVIPIVNLYTRY